MTASAEMYDWSFLGFSYSGKTQALVFKGQIRKEDNPYMFDQYARGKVKQHSVGMQYVEYALAVNSEDKYWRDEKENWDKYKDSVVNLKDDDHFWIITKARVIEGSAVLRGSNQATPTLSIKEVGIEQQQQKSIFSNFKFIQK
jgi:hypothetical protein